jgi:TRAP transporter 4TM/12TM fusion protein
MSVIRPPESVGPPVTVLETGLTVEEAIAEYDEERPSRRLSPGLDRFVTFWCFVAALMVLRQVFDPHPQGRQYYLISFLTAVLPLVFLTYRPRAVGARRALGGTDNPGPLDWVLCVVTLAVCMYPISPVRIGDGGGFDAFLDRQGSLSTTDVVMGVILTLLVLEAARRTTGPVIPVVCIAFLAYAYFGGHLPISWPISHAGIDLDTIVNGLYNEASGFFGTPLDVAASYIVLFTIYGAVLDCTGAGRFFIDISMAAFRGSRTAPGRTITLAGLLLGSVSGSGTATAVSLGAVGWPVLKRAGYPRDNAGGLLAAAGIGAILSPPTLGAAAFIIAEYLSVSYLDVLLWASVPTLLFYLGIALAVEIDARRFGATAVDLPRQSPWRLLRRFGYHFLSLGVIVVFLARDIPPFKAVVYATLVAALFGLAERVVSRRNPLDDDAVRQPLPIALRDYALELYHALATGIRSALPIVAVCAAAGIITSVIVKTGLGQSLADLLIDGAEAITTNPTAVLVLTTLFSAVAILVLGLAVPVTASFIISWVIIGPALQGLGVDGPAVAMFIFYFSVLSEVSPPTALAAVGAAAVTGGNVMRTMVQTAKYTLPAFLVPIAFVISENGAHLLGRDGWRATLWVALVSAVAVAALAVVTGGWIFGPARLPERLLCVPAAILLLYLEPLAILIGGCCFAAAIAVHLTTRRRQSPSTAT